MSAHGKLVQWVKARRVLRSRLAQVAREQHLPGNRDELMCMVVDLLDPQRDGRSAQMLKGMGVNPREANILWNELQGADPNWVSRMDWRLVADGLKGPR